MFDVLFIPVLERLHGKKLASLVGERSGSTVSERTVRNWINGITEPDPTHAQRIKDEGRIFLHATLLKRGWPPVEAEKYIEGMMAAKGVLSAFIHSISAENGDKYEHTHSLAQQIDEISAALLELRRLNKLKQFGRMLLNSDLLDPEHFVDPESESSNETLMETVASARTWDDLARPLGVIAFNLHMQLLATLDLEFCSKYLKEFAPTPVFDSLMPRLDPAATTDETGNYSTNRNLFHFPVRRLLDLSASLRFFRLKRRWPTDIPSVSEMAAWMRSEPATLTKWRTGRRFSLRNYESLWSAMFDDNCGADQPPTPGPLAFAAALLTHLYVKGSREAKDLTMYIPDPEIYLRWWRIQRLRIESKHGALPFGETAWMAALS